MKEKYTILVATGNEKEKNHVNTAFIGAGYNIIFASGGKEAMNISNKKRLHIALIYEELSDMDGITLVKGLRKWFDAPIIMLSPTFNEKDVVEALDAGANDYFSSQFGTEEHFARIRAALRTYVLRRERHRPGEGFSVGGLSINYDSRKVSVDGKKIHLTPIEFRIVSLLTNNAGNVLTHDQIIDEIWGPYNSDNVVLRVNMANIRKKIEPNPGMPKYILTEVGVGYRVAVG